MSLMLGYADYQNIPSLILKSIQYQGLTVKGRQTEFIIQTLKTVPLSGPVPSARHPNNSVIVKPEISLTKLWEFATSLVEFIVKVTPRLSI